ncbi:hypothetical protein OsJ_12040 [Oryza sativa Japonica Group]|uniref:NPH3 domain-containing protein n=1 Tax=Oryza sativa subsp. japonica TaxID=39947 RepID=B9FA76_ORYSJ|nr:hypothetical protein OsJ_12040 [Oryza sativa Japonica Group]
MSKSARKRLCRVLNCRKLLDKACMHAAQNELLLLRMVVQVLFLKHARAAAVAGRHAAATELPSNIKALPQSKTQVAGGRHGPRGRAAAPRARRRRVAGGRLERGGPAAHGVQDRHAADEAGGGRPRRRR